MDKIDVENLKKKILSYEEYGEHPRARSDKDKAYVYVFNRNGKTLTVYGSPHTNNPENPVFDEIEEFFEKTKPDIVFFEGMEGAVKNRGKIMEKAKNITLEEAKSKSEAHFALKLAVDAGVDFDSPEPTFQRQVVKLGEKGYAKQDIFNFYMYRSITQYQRTHQDRDPDELEKYLQSSLDRFRRTGVWNNAELIKFKKELLDNLDIEDEEKYKNRVDPVLWEGKEQTIINQISREVSTQRDEYILERIAEAFESYNRIFVVYGFTHAVRLEPALQTLMESQKILNRNS